MIRKNDTTHITHNTRNTRNTRNSHITRFISVLLVIIILAAGMQTTMLAQGQVFPPYTMTLRFTDDIQITYTYDYPSRGVWTRAEDVPIGGTEISSQVYCVDPFVAFHSRVTDLGGSSGFEAKTWSTVDTVTGYVDGALWAYSGTYNREVEAVKWIVANGYRGNFLAHDADSRASVARLQDMSGIADIDETVALMATKVSIWKILAGDSVTVASTSIDGPAGTSARREAFDALVAFLVDAAVSGGGFPGETAVTSFSISLDIGSYEQKNQSSGDGFDYYGPVTVNAELLNYTGSPDEIKVFLTAVGFDSGAISFVNTTFGALAEDEICGTNTPAPYVTVGNGSAGGGTAEFFLKVDPSIRNDADPSGDNITIKAMAVAEHTGLVKGTPVTYIFADDDVQNWDMIQAFAGAAGSDAYANLFADAVVNTGSTPEIPVIPEEDIPSREQPGRGQLYVAKTVDNATPLDKDTLFTFQVYRGSNDGAGDSPNPGDLLNLSKFPVYGAFSVNYSTNEFTLKNGGMAYIDGLPVDDNVYYRVAEVNIPAEFNINEPKYTIDISPESQGLTTGSITIPFRIDVDFETAMATFHNSRKTTNENEPVEGAYLWVGKAALDSLVLGHHISNAVFEFTLEYSDDNGLTWAPVALDKTVIDDPAKIVSDGKDGRFCLKTTEAAYFELNPACIYRVAEKDPGPEYAYISYALRYYYLDNKEFITEKTDFLKWNDMYANASKDLTVGGITFGENNDYFYRLAFGNYAIGQHDLTFGKIVDGEAPEDEMFKFQFEYMGYTGFDDNGNPVGDQVPLLLLPLSVTPAPGMFVVEGVAADRISTDSNGLPSVLALKAGETVTIRNLMEASYTIRELTTGYVASFSVGDNGNNGTVGGNGGNGGAYSNAVRGVAVINLTSDLSVVYKNSKTPEQPEQPDQPDQPGQPDQPNQPGQPEQPGQPGQPDQPGQPGQPDVDKPSGPDSPDTDINNPGSPSGGLNPKTRGQDDLWISVAFILLGLSWLAGVCALSKRMKGKTK